MSLSKTINKNRIQIQLKNFEDLAKLNDKFYQNIMLLFKDNKNLNEIDLLKTKQQLQILVNLLLREYEKITYENFKQLYSSHMFYINQISELLKLPLFSDEILKTAIDIYSKKWTSLSKLIWKNWKEIQNDVILKITEAVTTWKSSEQLWTTLKPYLLNPNKWANYKLWRVWRTELARVHSEITRQTVIDINKDKINDYYILLKYNLWNAKEHWTEDEKNANRDIWFWKWIYTPKTAPSIPVHPNCLCYYTNVLIDKKTWKEINL